MTTSPGVTCGRSAARATSFCASVVGAFMALSQAQIGAAQLVAGQQLGGRAGKSQRAVLQHVGAVGDLERLADVLLDEQHRQAVVAQAPDQREHLLDEDRRQAERRFVEDEQARLGHQAAADRQHLLLAAAHRAGPLALALGKAREGGEDALEVACLALVRAGIRAELQVLAHAEVGEDAPPLGHLDEPGLDDTAGVRACQHLAAEAHFAIPRGQQRADGVVQGGLAGAVAAEERDDLARKHVEGDAAQHLDATVAGAQLAHLQQGLAHAAIPCRRAAAP